MDLVDCSNIWYADDTFLVGRHSRELNKIICAIEKTFGQIRQETQQRSCTTKMSYNRLKRPTKRRKNKNKTAEMNAKTKGLHLKAKPSQSNYHKKENKRFKRPQKRTKHAQTPTKTFVKSHEKIKTPNKKWSMRKNVQKTPPLELSRMNSQYFFGVWDLTRKNIGNQYC